MRIPSAGWKLIWAAGLLLAQASAVALDGPPSPAATPAVPDKKLPLPGDVFLINGHPAFLIPGQAAPRERSKPWVWYAPTLPGLPGQEELWLFQKFTTAGIAIAGVDVGESYGSPNGSELFSQFHAEMTSSRGFANKTVLLGRSRGGLMTLSWAISHPEKVAAWAGIYPVCNLASYPGVAKAAGAYEMTSAELQARLVQYNPVDRLAALSAARIPLFAIHGDVDLVVPLADNSGLVKERYSALGGTMQLVIAEGQGHNMWPGFFQSPELVRFVIAHASSKLLRSTQVDNVSTSRHQARELIRDPHFRGGFNLIDPQPGRRLVYARLPSVAAGFETEWDLDQWSSRFPLASADPSVPVAGVDRWANPGKTVTRAAPDLAEGDLSLALNANAEYDQHARKAGEPWVHLLVEQSFVDPPSLGNVRSARLHIQARLLRSEFHRTDDYSPGLHAAQFQLFLMVQNRNPASLGCGKLVWFGVPLYDDRSRFPQEFKQQDTGGTAMFIFTPGGEVFSKQSAHERQWISVDKELLPLLREALETAWQRGFLRESLDLADYRITGMNMGWEVPGLFDVEMQVKDLSLRVLEH